MPFGRFARSCSGGILIAGLVFAAACSEQGSASFAPHDPTRTTSSALAAPADWFSTASMSTQRAQHAAVLLPSGKLLVIGGVARTGFVTTAELYDPATDTWSSAGDVGLTGNIMQALLLPNGKVLVLADGATAGRLYDPVTGAWSASGAMSLARSIPSLTLLRTGKVLVAGGANAGGRLTSAELYDPETNTFTATGAMTMSRGAHSATLLASGKVLAVSGFDGDGEVPGADLYDPATGTWTAAAPPILARHYASSTLLPDGRVLFVGGFTTSGATAQTEMYDPPSNTWTVTGSLVHARSSHSTTLLPSGKVLVTGGALFRQAPEKEAELYDPATGTWSLAGTMATGRESHTATLLPSGKVFIAGGSATAPETTFFATTELYDPAVNGWSAAGALATPRSRAASALLPSGKVLVAGGRNAGGTTVGASEFYDRTTNGWSAAASLATPRERATATALPSGTVLVAGGTSGDGSASFATTELYDPAANTWTPGASLASARHLHSATSLADGKLLVVGGLQNTTTLASAELYDPTANTWTAAGAPATARSEHAAVRLPSGRVLVAGGRSSTGAALASAELYDPATNTWSPASSLAEARQSFTLTLLPSGQVLASGGASGATEIGTSELYDPATNTWTSTGALGQARWGHTASLMPSGEVLVAGGLGSSGNADAAEVYDPTIHGWRGVANAAVLGELVATTLPDGQVLLAGGTAATTSQLYEDTGAKASSRPIVTSPDHLYAGCAGAIEGQRFQGIAAGGAGNYSASPTDYPLVRLQAAEGGHLWALSSRDWSSTAVTVDVPGDVPAGSYALSVLANAIGGGRMVTVAPNVAPTAADKTVAGATGAPLPIVVTATDAEPDQPLTYTVVTPPTHGTLSGTLPSVVYTPDPGFVGADSFTFTARDCGKDSNVATVAITVVDPPTITCPANVTLEAQSKAGVEGAWPDAVATDDATSPPSVTYTPARGSVFPLGSTTVTATAEDASGVSASCVFQVIVKDTKAPKLTCPANVTANATSHAGAIVWFDLPAATDAVSTPSVTADPTSGSVFPVGKTEVTVRAKDAAGNAATCTFQVVVGPSSDDESSSGDDTGNGANDGTGNGAKDGGGGCHLAAGSTSRMSSPLGIAFGLAMLAGLRRRRRGG
jgi:large repetitive protein